MLSNQSGVGRAVNGKRAATFKGYTENLVRDLAVPHERFVLLAALQKDKYRKPDTGMWDLLSSMMGHVDLASSFYVGDAGGRASDFSDSDLLFAKAVGLVFHHAVDYFDAPSPRHEQWYDQIRGHEIAPLPPGPRVVVLCGPPGAGKTSFCESLNQCVTYTSGLVLYDSRRVRLSQDVLGNRKKCLFSFERLLDHSKDAESNFTIFIDRTNMTREQRSPWTGSGLPTMLVVLCTPLEECKSRIKVRALHEGKEVGVSDTPPLVSAAVRMVDGFESPIVEEGWDRIWLIKTEEDLIKSISLL